MSLTNHMRGGGQTLTNQTYTFKTNGLKDNKRDLESVLTSNHPKQVEAFATTFQP